MNWINASHHKPPENKLIFVHSPKPYKSFFVGEIKNENGEYKFWDLGRCRHDSLHPDEIKFWILAQFPKEPMKKEQFEDLMQLQQLIKFEIYLTENFDELQAAYNDKQIIELCNLVYSQVETLLDDLVPDLPIPKK